MIFFVIGKNVLFHRYFILGASLLAFVLLTQLLIFLKCLLIKWFYPFTVIGITIIKAYFITKFDYLIRKKSYSIVAIHKENLNLRVLKVILTMVGIPKLISIQKWINYEILVQVKKIIKVHILVYHLSSLQCLRETQNLSLILTDVITLLELLSSE